MLKKLERKDEFRSLEYLVKDCIHSVDENDVGAPKREIIFLKFFI